MLSDNLQIRFYGISLNRDGGLQSITFIDLQCRGSEVSDGFIRIHPGDTVIAADVDASGVSESEGDVRKPFIAGNFEFDGFCVTFRQRPGIQAFQSDVSPAEGVQRIGRSQRQIQRRAVGVARTVDLRSEITSGGQPYKAVLFQSLFKSPVAVPEGIGIEEFEFWCPKRRPEGKNFAMRFTPAIDAFGVGQLRNSYYRPYLAPNGWAPACDDPAPELRIDWERPETFSRMRLFFDTDADHAMENVQMGHYDSVMPGCIRSCRLTDDTVTTGEGVYIGSSEDDVKAAYGEEGGDAEGMLSYTAGDVTLNFILEDGVVTSIEYLPA